MIERHHLLILEAIEKEGTLSSAANSLCLTQSALSQSIRKLEMQCGTKLWTISGRRIQLNDSGIYLLGVAKRILPQLSHADKILKDFASGSMGTLRIGMECHPCYKWILKVISPFLKEWPNVEVDIKRQFNFGGVAALYQYDIDLLVTPDPIFRKGVIFHKVFEYEHVLVVSSEHPLAKRDFIQPKDLAKEILITYPIEKDRLDIFKDFLTTAETLPKQHKLIEDTDIMLEMIASGRGVGAIPLWLALENQNQFSIKTVRLGKTGLIKHIHLGVREEDNPQYLKSFLKKAQSI